MRPGLLGAAQVSGGQAGRRSGTRPPHTAGKSGLAAVACGRRGGCVISAFLDRTRAMDAPIRRDVCGQPLQTTAMNPPKGAVSMVKALRRNSDCRRAPSVAEVSANSLTVRLPSMSRSRRSTVRGWAWPVGGV